MSSQASSALAEPNSSENPMPTLEFTYAGLPERFYERTRPTPVANPRLIKLNRELAEKLGLNPDRLASPEGIEVLAASRIPEGMRPSRRPMPGISSAISSRSSATAVRFCSARRSTPTACAATSS